MNLERLNHLIAVLSEVEDKQRTFFMGHWGLVRGPGDRHICNTSACALGWAALDPQFMNEGLHLVASWVDDPSSGDNELLSLVNNEAWQALSRLDDIGIDIIPIYGTARGFYAAMEFFGINEASANYLFDSSSYTRGSYSITPNHVIEHVQKIMLDGELPDYEDDDEDGNYEDHSEAEQDTPSEDRGFGV